MLSPSRPAMPTHPPFLHLFESLGRPPVAHAEEINHPALQQLVHTLATHTHSPGRCILLRAPRAGYGKTHLLCQAASQLPSHEFIPLQPNDGAQIDALTTTEDTLRHLGRPAGPNGLCQLDLATRQLLALAITPLVATGEVPCSDRESALSALTQRPNETFDFHHPQAATARWTLDHFPVLAPRITLELAQLANATSRSTAFWLDALFRFATTPTDTPGRLDALTATAATPTGHADGNALERLATLLSLLSLVSRVVLVADDLEGFSADQSAGLHFAAFLCTLRQSANRIDAILSVNDDVWLSAFAPRLTSGLADRLTEVVIELPDLSEPQMIALLESRAPGLGSSLLESLRPHGLKPFARGLLRDAAAIWPPPTPSQTPAPPALSPPEFPTIPTPTAEPASPPPAPPAFPTPEPTPPAENPSATPAPAEPVTAPPPTDTTPAAPQPAEPIPPALQASPFFVPSFDPDAPKTSVDAWHERTAPSSPFSAPSTSPAPPPPAQATADPNPTPPIDHDRVEELLRQFRERYSRPNH